MFQVMGVDPGLNNTGVVVMLFQTSTRAIDIREYVLDGLDYHALERLVNYHQLDEIYVEAYRPRSNFNQDRRLIEFVGRAKVDLGATPLDNMGVKNVVTKDLMNDIFGVWKSTLRSSHQDVRSAARIALFGMIKDERLNERLITPVVRDYLRGDPWTINKLN